ncbi:serine protease [Hoeflea sp. TYP-13]|uniref:serine protease n=1 Tax=Hoeflea sp. TYP-13 TaxID=3230023 RepID=UPI0034C6D366
MKGAPPQTAAELVDTQSILALEHLTGPCRGTVTWLWHPDMHLRLGPYGHMHVTDGPPNENRETWVARIRWAESGYEISVIEDQQLWVNGKPVESQLLKHHDMIEFGNNGPMSRCYVYDNTHPMRESVGDILSDTVAYFRSSRQPAAKRFLRSCRQLASRLASETTTLFRFSVIAVLLILGGLAYQQGRINALLTQQVESGKTELENFSRTLARSREEALTPDDLAALSSELQGQIATTAERVEDIERRSEASANVIAEATPSILFLQGSWGFKEKDSDRMLRQVLDANGKPIVLPNGTLSLSLEGNGPIAERQYTGTGFFIGDEGLLVTNRHVGLPWEYDANIKMILAQGLEPVMTKFIGYLPGVETPVPIELVTASETADLAILRQTEPGNDTRGLRLADASPDPGDEIIVLGYPTGLRSMLAQAGKRFLEDLRKSGDTGFWIVSQKLADAGRILPLASRGIVGGTSEETIAYDAETTHGGSGGPVLDINGDVVAVNAAILPEYGGSNLGVPVEKVRELLNGAKLN